jgi:transposase, IS5 family
VNFAQNLVEIMTPNNRFLEEMQKAVPWRLLEAEMTTLIARKTGGRPAYPLLLLLKMHLLQTWYGLSDAECEHQIRDRLSFRAFLGLGITERVPDSTTLETFRHDLASSGLSDKLVETLDKFFKEQGLLLKAGNMVDATFVKANSRPHKDAEKNSDQDADHGHKGFGYSGTANVDVKSKLIRKMVVTSERPHDSQNLPAVLVGDETLLYGDSGYQGTQALLKKQGCKPRIIAKSQRGKKGEKAPELKPRVKQLNRLYSKIRARVEHVFACFKRVFKVTHVWYRGLERVNQQFQSLTMAYNLRRFGFLQRATCV